MTLTTLVNLIISVSDDTAANTLIRTVRRPAMEALSPRNAPFPTTREAFILKAGPALGAEWRAASPAGHRILLGHIAAHPFPTGELGTVTAGVEWHMTAAELCTLLDATYHLPPSASAPGR